MARYPIRIALFLLLATMAGAQTMTEYGAVAAGSVVGGASGKAVSEGISAIFGKMDDQTVKAASKGEDKPRSKPAETSAVGAATSIGAPSNATAPFVPSAPLVADVPASPSVPRAARAKRQAPVSVDTTVPPPPPLVNHIAEHKPVVATVAPSTAPVVPFRLATLADVLPATPIPPPPTMTPEAFKKIVAGMSKPEVLRLGDPSSKIAMFEDGHMVEMFSYRAGGQRYGRLRLEDGTVVAVEAK
jgi:hypothetical protein